MQFLNASISFLSWKSLSDFPLLWGKKRGLPIFYLALAYHNWWGALRQLGSAGRYCVTNRGILLSVVLLFSVPERGCAIWEIRELKQPPQRQQKKPHKFAYLTMKNTIFARFAPAFFIFWHFEDILVLSTTWNDLFCSCVDDVTIRWQMFNSQAPVPI